MKQSLFWLLTTVAMGTCLAGTSPIAVRSLTTQATASLLSHPISTGGLRANIAPPIALHHQPRPLINRQLFFQNPEIDTVQISPNGQYLAFRKSSNGRVNVWVKRLDESLDQALPITAQTTDSVPFYVWSADSQYIIYGQDNNGDENFQLYAVDPSTAFSTTTALPTAKNLTPFETIQTRIYAIPKATPQDIVVGINDRDPRFHDVYRIHLPTGQRTLLHEVNESITQWTVDHNGNLRLATRETEQGITEILSHNPQGLVPIYSCSLLETCEPIHFHPDNNQVYITTNKGEEQDLTQLILLNLTTQSSQVISSDPEAEVDFEGAIFSSATHKLLGTFYIGDRQRVHALDPEFQSDWSYLQQQFLDQNIAVIGALTENDQLALIQVQSDRNPGSTYLFDRQNRSLEKIYDRQPDLNPQQLATMHPVRYRSRDNVEIPAYLTLPPGVPAQNLPAIVFPHRGPWGKDTWGFNPQVQFFANRGYAVLQPNFRGSAGYGQAFLNAGNQTWGTGIMQHDVSDGTQYLIDQGIADPERIGIFGDSYGGYATLSGLAFTPELYAAGVSLAGPSNLLSLLATIPPYWAPLRELFAIRLGDIDNPTDRDRLQRQSPLFSAHQIQAPLLIIHGANDARVSKNEADQMAVALRDLDSPVEYLLAPNEGHGYRQAENILAAMAKVEQFFATHLGGQYQESISPTVQQRLDNMTVDIETLNLDEVSAPSKRLQSTAIEPTK